MRTATLFATALLSLSAACSSSTSGNDAQADATPDVAPDATPDSTSPDATPDVTSPDATPDVTSPDVSEPDAAPADGGNCLPSCIAGLFSPECMPMGTCMQQSDPSTPNDFVQCFSNGVRVSVMTNGTGGTVTVRNGSHFCFGETAGADGMTATLVDEAGNTIATITPSATDSQVATVTCNGMTYTVDGRTCSNLPSWSGSCSQGACP